MLPFTKRRIELVQNILESLDECFADGREFCELFLLDNPRRILEDVARKRGITNPTNHNKKELIKLILDTYEK